MTARIYSAIVVLAALLALTLSMGRIHPEAGALILLLGALTFLAEWLAFPTAFGSTVSLAFSLHYAAVLLGGPVVGAIVALFSTLSPQDIAEHKQVHRVVFNAAQMVLSALIAGATYLALGGSPLYGQAAGIEQGTWLLAALGAALSLAATNFILVGLAIALSAHMSILNVWRLGLRSYIVSFGALTLLGMVLARLIVVAGVFGVVLLIVPFLVARQTFQVYRELAQAYKETVTSLVTLVEAKDPYTRGHSERVALYVRDMAEEVGLPEARIQSLELAALLHDVGKVGIPTTTLLKPGPLTDEEFEQVRLHPLTASSILSDIRLLEGVVPLIEAHHERLDGSGYPYGLTEDEFPVEAKILAVADSFDAMTSNRAYRPALDYQAACDELLRCAGSKLDKGCVEALMARVTTERVAEVLDSSEELQLA